jgi:hypothetical protein
MKYIPLFLLVLLSCKQHKKTTESSVLRAPQENVHSTTYITSRKWTQVSGPNQSLILYPDRNTTPVQNLIAGVYNFEYCITNNLGFQGCDTVQITVLYPTLSLTLIKFYGRTNRFYNELIWEAVETGSYELLRNGTVINSGRLNNGSFKDYGFSEINKYQLRKTEYDGRQYYSEVLTLVNRPERTELITGFLNSKLYITITSKWKEQGILSVYSTSGACLYTQRHSVYIGNNRIEVNFPHASGIYIVNWRSEREVVTKKIQK